MGKHAKQASKAQAGCGAFWLQPEVTITNGGEVSASRHEERRARARAQGNVRAQIPSFSPLL